MPVSLRFVRKASASSAFVALFVLLARPGECLQDCCFSTYPLAQTMRQLNGSAIELLFRGNAFQHWYEDVDGFPVVETRSGYAYARRGADGRLEATEALVGASDPRLLGLERQIVPAPLQRATRPGSSPVQGLRGAFLPGARTVKNLVLLLRFSDHGPSGQDRTLPSSADVSKIMNAEGGDPALAPTGSVRDHYLENSYGQFTIDSTVVGWLDVPQSESYYADGYSGLTELIWELITAGLEQADPLVDFSEFDQDGDGWVDAITVLHSGYGAEWGGTDQYGRDYVDRIWSHMWTIPIWTSAEGVKVADYNISPGLWAISGSSPGRIGVVCHELGHFFGLPDLYDTDESSNGIGNWCLMAGGSWGFGGSQQYPSHLCAWCKLKLGWAEPHRLLPGVHSAAEIETHPALYMIDSGYPPGEYLLIENRQPVGFDGRIPQGGLAIWHVDDAKGSLSFNDPNDDEGYPGQAGWPENGSHYRVALLQADAGFDLENDLDHGDAGDLYHSGSAGSINSGSTPNTKAYQGGTLLTSGNRLQSFGASSERMAFTYVNNWAPTITTASLPQAHIGVPYSVALTHTGDRAPYTWSEFRDHPSYTLTDLGPQPFSAGGVAQGFRAGEATWSVDLPFLFPFYETSYSRVYVTPNGCVDFAPLNYEYYNTPGSLRSLQRIAGLWDDLTTTGRNGQDIYIDTSVSGEVRIRWQALTQNAGLPANFAITLHEDGRIRFDYGGGNTGITPTVGISRAHSGDLVLATTHDAQSMLTNADSLEFELLGSELPSGLTLSPAGVLSGTPTALGTFTFRARVSDNTNRYDQKLLSLEVTSAGIRPQ